MAQADLALPQRRLPDGDLDLDRAGDAAAGAVLTGRLRSWVTRRVGQHAETVGALARTLWVGWHTVMRA